MEKYIHSGYYDIFRPPYSLSNANHRSTIFCLSNKLNTALVLLPLTTSFFKDIIDIVKLHPARLIHIIAPDIRIAFVSDYYLSWDYITHTLQKECKIFSMHMVENSLCDDFKSDIIRTSNNNFSIEVPRSEVDVSVIDVTLTETLTNASTQPCSDVIIHDNYSRKLFCGEMTDAKAAFLNGHPDFCDEIHMPFITGNYSGWTYQMLIRNYPSLVSKTYCNLFASYEEFDYARSIGVKVGGRYHDSI